MAIWLMNGFNIMTSAGLGNVGIDWQVVGTADFNGDGFRDILWQDTANNLAIWLMNSNGISVKQSGFIGNTMGQPVAGTGDFNGDGNGDILFRDGSGNLSIWLMNGLSVLQKAGIGNPGSNFVVAVTGDFNGDGKTDILFRDTTTGALLVWFMNGFAVSSTANVATVPLIWTAQSLNAD